MEWLKRLNHSLDYIEKNLAGEIDYGIAAQKAYCSSYYFQRMFAYLSGITLSEYIRRRRMSVAAADLESGEKVIDVALKYGYQSPTAFNRAFQAVHGLPPSKAGKGSTLKLFPRISFKITVKGVEEMNYKIEKESAFRIIGLSRPLEPDMEKNFKVIPDVWAKASADGVLAALCTKMDGQPKGVLGVSVCEKEDDMKYMIAVASSAPKGGYDEYTVPETTWAKFNGRGTGVSIQVLLKQIMTEWMPNSGYEYDMGAPEIELYLDDSATDMEYEVWVPVIKK